MINKSLEVFTHPFLTRSKTDLLLWPTLLKSVLSEQESMLLSLCSETTFAETIPQDWPVLESRPHTVCPVPGLGKTCSIQFKIKNNFIRGFSPLDQFLKSQIVYIDVILKHLPPPAFKDADVIYQDLLLHLGSLNSKKC